MEAEERPNKLRKLETSYNNDDAVLNDSQAVLDQAASANSKLTTDSTNNDPPPVVRHNDSSSNEQPDNEQQESTPSEPISKNQLKKLRRKEAWEAGRDYRKAKRKEKIQAKKARRRTEREEQTQTQQENGTTTAQSTTVPRFRRPTRMPVAIVIDCGFDDLMLDKERISLGSQLTRSYSDVHRAPYQAHLYVSSWNGLLKERFDTVLSGHYLNWKDVIFTEQDFVGAAEQARSAMQSKCGGKMVAAFEKYAEHNGSVETSKEATISQANDNVQGATDQEHNQPEHVSSNGSITHASTELAETSKGDIIYLTSESPDTLTALHPHHTYVVGGLVDKNRHKGICYKTACDRGVRTAKLPIGEYMEMTSRYVLATNHVVEIMLKWLECGDWAEAFMAVMPKRKGGRLKTTNAAEDDDEETAVDGRVGEEGEKLLRMDDEGEEDFSDEQSEADADTEK